MYLFSPYRRLKNVSISLEETRWMFPVAIMSQLSPTGNMSNNCIDLVKTLSVFGSHDLIL